MWTSFFLGFFAIGLPSAQLAQRSNCDYYPQKAIELKCDANNYLIRFGQHYCEEFQKVEAEFSPEGQKTLEGLRTCLMQSLDTESGVTCDNVESIAAKSHVSCYLNQGYCDMSYADKWRIFAVVWQEMIVNPNFNAVVQSIEAGCAAQGKPIFQNAPAR